MNIKFTSAILLGLLVFMISCSKNEPISNYSSIELQDKKEFPNDLFSFQRSYPYKKFDVLAYEDGLQAVRTEKLTKNNSPGFGEAWVNQGPGNAGARINSIATHPTDEDIIYLGYSTGGVFKTTDGGDNWTPIFDDQPFLSIGDITLDPSDPQTIYVGTGDPNITGYPAIGNGIYKSEDGGLTWTHLGLSAQRIISKIIVDPIDTDIIYVACMGLPMERNNERGLYKSIDGGANWDQILFVSDQAGIIDMVMAPNNPDILYASSWDRIRNNEESIVYGPNAFIHKSIDGGQTWNILTNGLPSGEQGRIGLAISESNPDVLICVYVATDQNLEGMFRTEDAGASWTEVPTENQNGLGSEYLGGFGWYFGQLRIHPVNDTWYYALGVTSWFTSNGGTIWTNLPSGSSVVPHVDYHDLVFNHQNDVLIATDGGAYKREVGTLTFNDIENIPATQVYRTAYDPNRPNQYFGGTQDNGTQVGNEVGMSSWDRILGGDGFQMQFHPTDSNIVYAETQRGNIFRSTSGLSGFISSNSGITPTDRRHWDMQYFISPHEPDRLYTGTYRVYKTDTEGAALSWNSISPDLTDGNILGSPFHTISTITESPVEEGLLYVGTTDANVWRSNDDGTNWDSIHMDLPERYITSVKASPDQADVVYVCLSGYRYNEYLPRVYKSVDRGNNWVSIAGNLPDIAVNDIVIVPGQSEEVLFVATDGGIYATANGGTTWELLGTGMPLVTTYDLEINEANNYLIAGTFGRSIYTYPIDSILNNLSSGVSVFGSVYNKDGVGIDSVFVTVEGDINQTVQSNVDGDFTINNFTAGNSCSIKPVKDINIRNKLTTFDLVQMQRHILFIDTLDTPYQILSGDVNQSNSMTNFDVIIIRKVLLLDQDTFMNTPSWGFVPADFEFDHPHNPFLDDVPTTMSCVDIQNGQPLEFIGFKMGDASGDALPGNFTNSADDRTLEKVDFVLNDMELKKNKTYNIPVKAKDFKQVFGFQMAMHFSENLLFESIEPGALEAFNNSNYYFNEENNDLRFSWSNANSSSLDEESTLFYIEVKALNDLTLSDALTMSASNFSAELYKENDQIFEPQLSFIPQFNPITSVELEVFPNPFSKNTTIQFAIPQQSQVAISVINTLGESVYFSNNRLEAGNHQITIDADELSLSKGIYFVSLQIGNNKINQKVILN